MYCFKLAPWSKFRVWEYETGILIFFCSLCNEHQLRTQTLTLSNVKLSVDDKSWTADMTNNCELCWQSRILSHESLLEVRLNSFDAIGYSSCSCSHSFSGTREFPTGKHLKLIHIFSWKSPRISVEIFYSLSLIICPYNPLFRISALPTTSYLIFSHFSLILSLLRVIMLWEMLSFTLLSFMSL